MKHWHDGKNRVALRNSETIGHHRCHRVQESTAVRVHDTFRVARCAARVTHTCRGVLGNFFELCGSSFGQQFFVVVRRNTGEIGRNFTLAVIHDHEMLHRGERWQ